MSQMSVLVAKLAGIRKALTDVMEENVSRNRSRGEALTRSSFDPELVAHYFTQAAAHIERLKVLMPDMYGDFQTICTDPSLEMMPKPDGSLPKHFSRAQTERLVRDIDQIFEVRANSGLEQSRRPEPQRIFISHGRSN